MAQSQYTTVYPEAWIADLDSIDPFWNCTTFAFSPLGRLPTELFKLIFECLPCNDLPALAQVSPRLRELVELQMYDEITIQPKDDWHAHNYFNPLWSLYCTLSQRSDLASRVHRLDLLVLDRLFDVDVPTFSVLPTGLPFSSIITCKIPEPHLAGALLQLLPNVAHLSMLMIIHFLGQGYKKCEFPLMDTPLTKMFPGFDHKTAHLEVMLTLQNLKRLDWCGATFHWFLAQSLYLEELHLMRPCTILVDEEDCKINHSVKILTLKQRSALLDPRTGHLDGLSQLLGHFDSLQRLQLCITDDEIDNMHCDLAEDINDSFQGSYAPLFEVLTQASATLVELDLSVSPEGPIYTDNLLYLDCLLPAQGFLELSSLKILRVPYAYLFSYGDSNPKSAPSELLPASLQYLQIDAPSFSIYEWLAQLPRCRSKLSVLNQIFLSCSNQFGDSYERFAFISHPHPVEDALKSIGITLKLGYSRWDWNLSWEDYDLPALELVAWVESLGSP